MEPKQRKMLHPGRILESLPTSAAVYATVSVAVSTICPLLCPRYVRRRACLCLTRLHLARLHLARLHLACLRLVRLHPARLHLAPLHISVDPSPNHSAMSMKHLPLYFFMADLMKKRRIPLSRRRRICDSSRMETIPSASRPLGSPAIRRRGGYRRRLVMLPPRLASIERGDRRAVPRRRTPAMPGGRCRGLLSSSWSSLRRPLSPVIIATGSGKL